jgi:catalase
MNAKGEGVWVKYHLKCDQGIKCLTAQEAARIAGENPDYCHLDLLHAIERKEFPSWTVKVQIMPVADAQKYRFNPFDLTKVWSQKDIPLLEIGKLVLNRNPENYFAEIEQAAFDPANFVPGIGPSPDKMLQGRLFAYGDAHRYRLGINHTQLPVNRPKAAESNNYGRDGYMRSDGNAGRAKNYEPNSFGGPAQTNEAMYTHLELHGTTGSFAWEQHKDDNDFVQAGDLYRLMSEEEKKRLVGNIAGSLSRVSREEIIEKSISHFRSADKDFGDRLTKAIKALRSAV